MSDLAKVRTLGRRCDMVVAVSEAAARDSICRGFPRKKVRVIPNGSVLDRFRHPSTSRAAVRSQLGIDPDAVVVLSFCWTPERKGADLLVAATDGLREDSSPRPVVLVITGEARTRAYLEAMVGTPPPPWLRLTRPFEDVADLFAASDVFVSTAREDAFSYAIGEAMACGLPVVSSDIPGPAHYFPAEGVVTFPTQDVGSLRLALRNVIRSETRSHLGEANRRFVSERLSVERYVDRVLGAYGELLER
ncbi:MAG: glycosyltransferase family 4 protein [Solirubrobacteraceae bacterium]